MKRLVIFCLIIAAAISCTRKQEKNGSPSSVREFDPSSLKSDMVPVKQVYGQLLYMPVYSNMPYQIDTVKFDMSAFVAVHNTDLRNPISLTKVLYFNQNGKLVDDFLGNKPIKLDPLATKDFYIPYEDQSGTGANFLIEWVADSLVNEPLVESITLCLKPNNTVAVLSKGKIISEKH